MGSALEIQHPSFFFFSFSSAVETTYIFNLPSWKRTAQLTSFGQFSALGFSAARAWMASLVTVESGTEVCAMIRTEGTEAGLGGGVFTLVLADSRIHALKCGQWSFDNNCVQSMNTNENILWLGICSPRCNYSYLI